MADPRDGVVFDGIGYEAETFSHDGTIVYDATKANGSAQVGLAVTLAAAKTAGLVGDGEFVLGKLIKVELGGKCVVQTGGHMELPGGDGASLTPGKKIVGDLGVGSAEGYVREVNTEHAVSRGAIIDASTPAATVVRMESAT